MKTKRITRSTVEGMVLTGVQEAKFVSLVKSPANQRAFSVLRSDEEETKVSKEPANRVRRTKRSDSDNVASVVFPEGYTEETVLETLKSYGLGGFDVSADDNGIYSAVRSDLQSIAPDKLVAIKLTSDNIVANVVAPETPAAEGKQNVAIQSIEFSSDNFSRADAVAWLKENNVDFDEEAIDNPAGTFVLQRSELPEGEEVRDMELAKGVIAKVIRNDYVDVPSGLITVVCEAAYCGWGWGQLDFAAQLADIEFGEKMRHGLYAMEDVLRNILFHSGLPVDDRKALAQRTLTQFGVFVGGLLDQLPRQLLVSVTSTQRNDKAKEPEMSKENESKAITITEAELDTRIAAAIRKDRETNAAAPAATTEAEPAKVEAAPAAEAAPLTRSDLAAVMKDALAPVAERLEKLEGVTVVRSDDADPKVDEAAEKVAAAQRKDDPFAGTLNLFGRR